MTSIGIRRRLTSSGRFAPPPPPSPPLDAARVDDADDVVVDASAKGHLSSSLPPPQLICRPIRDAGRDIKPPPWRTVGTIVIGRDSCSLKGECSTRTWSIARTVARFDERMEGGKEAGGGGGEASDDLMECDATGYYFSVKGGELSCYEYSPRTILFPILQAHQDPPYPHQLSTSPGLLPFYPNRW